MNWLANLHRSHVRVVAVVVLVLTGAALAGLPRLAFDDDPRSMVRAQRTEFDQLEAFYTDFGPDDQDVLLLIEGDLFSLPAQSALRNTMRALRSLPEVESVVGLLDVRRRGLIPIPLIPTSNLTPERLADARAAALRNPVACGQFLSADAQTTVINVRLTGRKLPVYQLEPAVKLLRSTAAEHLNPAGLALRLAGHPPMRIDLLLTLRFEVIKFAMLGMLISGGIAIVVFRSPSAILLTSLGPAAGVIWTLGGMGWVGVKIDPLTVVLPTLMFVIGFTDSVHLVTDMRCSRAKGLSARESAAACGLTPWPKMA